MIEDLIKESPLNKIFVFGDRTLLLELIKNYLGSQIPTSQISIVIGSQKTKDARQGRVVLGTFSCIGTGISWSEFNCIVYWHPRCNKHKQFLNRVFRESSDRNVMRKIYYLQDNATSIKSQYSGLQSVWKTMFPNQKPIIDNVSYEEIEVSPEIQQLSKKFASGDHSLEEHSEESSEDDEI